MKSIKQLSLVLLLLLSFACSNNDDDNNTPSEPTTHELMMSGKWFWESSSIDALDDCQKLSTLEFVDDDTVLIENIHEDVDSNCISTGVQSLVYNFIDDDHFSITSGTTTLNYTIDFISSTRFVTRVTYGPETITSTFIK